MCARGDKHGNRRRDCKRQGARERPEPVLLEHDERREPGSKREPGAAPVGEVQRRGEDDESCRTESPSHQGAAPQTKPEREQDAEDGEQREGVCIPERARQPEARLWISGRDLVGIAHRLDLDVIEGMAELGLLGIVIPEEYGGAGLDFVAEALACEEIERGEAAFRTLISVHVGLNSLSLLRYASDEQKERYLVPQARGERIACFGLTEPGAGSDVASMRTTATREGDVYLLNGQKNWISYAAVCLQ